MIRMPNSLNGKTFAAILCLLPICGLFIKQRSLPGDEYRAQVTPYELESNLEIL